MSLEGLQAAVDDVLISRLLPALKLAIDNQLQTGMQAEVIIGKLQLHSLESGRPSVTPVILQVQAYLSRKCGRKVSL
jgi:hypothetical protein